MVGRWAETGIEEIVAEGDAAAQFSGGVPKDLRQVVERGVLRVIYANKGTRKDSNQYTYLVTRLKTDFVLKGKLTRLGRELLNRFRGCEGTCACYQVLTNRTILSVRVIELALLRPVKRFGSQVIRPRQRD